MLTFSFLTSSVAAAFTVGYLQDPNFEMQQIYLSNFFTRLEGSG